MTQKYNRVVGAAVAAVVVLSGCGGKKETASGPAPSGPAGKKIVVGYSQIGAESDWRKANTDSIVSEAKARGIDLKFSDAQQKQENQIKALKAFVAQKVDVIGFSPVVETGWGPVIKEINEARIPLIILDRRPDVDDSKYVTFIGSDFVEEGRRAARWLAKYKNGKAVIAELQGTTGSAPALDRKKGFAEVIKDYPGMKIVVSQTGDFTRAKGKEVMEAFLKGPYGKQIDTLFAHNDDMALGAIQAIEAAGRRPGKDITIVSIDSVRMALEAIKAGKINCSVECNPIIGGQFFDAVEKVMKGETLPKRIEVKEGVFDATNVEAALPTRKY